MPPATAPLKMTEGQREILGKVARGLRSNMDRVGEPQPLTTIVGRALITRMVTANTSAASGRRTATLAAPCRRAPSFDLQPSLMRRTLRARSITCAITGEGLDAPPTTVTIESS